jgi:hypothetical protein
VKAFVLVALLLAGSGQALAQDAISQAKAVTAGHAKPVRIAPQRAAPESSGAATSAASLPTAVPEQFSPPQEAYASFPEAAATREAIGLPALARQSRDFQAAAGPDWSRRMRRLGCRDPR